jgi:hypothetical protein
MATFLELAKKVAAESGTVGGDGQPLSVVNQSGRLLKIVNWTSEAWTEIQNRRSAWQFMQGEYSGATLAGQQRYAGSDFGAARFATFDHGSMDAGSPTIYLTADGPDAEGPLRYLSWKTLFGTHLKGANRTKSGKPTHYAIAPSGEMVLWPIPDASYTISGTYRKTPQVLAANGDIPDMPERFHELIKWQALLQLAMFDESLNQFPLWRITHARLMSDLERDQLPRWRMAEPFA